MFTIELLLFLRVEGVMVTFNRNANRLFRKFESNNITISEKSNTPEKNYIQNDNKKYDPEDNLGKATQI